MLRGISVEIGQECRASYGLKIVDNSIWTVRHCVPEAMERENARLG